jgi:hypothetical protein
VSRPNQNWLIIGTTFVLGSLCVLSWASGIGFPMWGPADWLHWPMHVAWLTMLVVSFRRAGWLGALGLLPLALLLPFALFAGFLTYMCAVEGACP